MTLNLSLLLKADAKDFVSGVRDAKAEVTALGAETRRQTPVIGTNLPAAMSRTTAASGQMRAGLDRLDAPLQSVVAQLESGQSPLQTFILQGAQLAGAFFPIPALFTGIAGALAVGITNFIRFSDEVDNAELLTSFFSDTLSRSTEKLKDQIAKTLDASEAVRKLTGAMAENAKLDLLKGAREQLDELAALVAAAARARISAEEAVNAELGSIGNVGIAERANVLADLGKALESGLGGQKLIDLADSLGVDFSDSLTGSMLASLADQADRLAEYNALISAALTPAGFVFEPAPRGSPDKDDKPRGRGRRAEPDLFADLTAEQAARGRQAILLGDLFNAGLKQTVELQAEFDKIRRQLLGPTEALKVRETELRQLRDAGLDDATFEKALAAARRETADETKRLRDEELRKRTDFGAGLERGLASLQERFRDTASTVESSLTSAFMGTEDALLEFVKNGEVSLEGLGDLAGEVARGIIADFSRIAIREALLGPLASAVGGFFGGGGVGAVAATPGGPGQRFAKGGVFGRHGIVDRPTLFPFAKGIGLMGEAGPEAIVPLHRGPGGELGIASHGPAAGGPVSVDVKIINQSGTQLEGSATARQGRGGQLQIEVMVRDAVRAQLGGGEHDGAMERRYGILPNRMRR